MLNDFHDSLTYTEYQDDNQHHDEKENVSDDVKKFYKYVEDTQ